MGESRTLRERRELSGLSQEELKYIVEDAKLGWIECGFEEGLPVPEPAREEK